jgi:hypothetical protein
MPARLSTVMDGKKQVVARQINAVLGLQVIEILDHRKEYTEVA